MVGWIATWVDIADIKIVELHFVLDFCAILVCQFVYIANSLNVVEGCPLLGHARAHYVSSATYHIHISIKVLETSKKIISSKLREILG